MSLLSASLVKSKGVKFFGRSALPREGYFVEDTFASMDYDPTDEGLTMAVAEFFTEWEYLSVSYLKRQDRFLAVGANYSEDRERAIALSSIKEDGKVVQLADVYDIARGHYTQLGGI